jgi:hypothetical protein
MGSAVRGDIGSSDDRLGHRLGVPPSLSTVVEGRTDVSRPYRAQMVFHRLLGRCPRLS